MLYDLGLTFFYVSSYFALGFDSIYETLVMPIHVSTFLGDSLVVDRVY